MRILVDMNLSPLWVDVFRRENWEAVHWSSVGDSAATDAEILRSAAESESIIFTHDLDFGALLASSAHRKPSVIQLRSQETSPAAMGAIVVLP